MFPTESNIQVNFIVCWQSVKWWSFPSFLIMWTPSILEGSEMFLCGLSPGGRRPVAPCQECCHFGGNKMEGPFRVLRGWCKETLLCLCYSGANEEGWSKTRGQRLDREKWKQVPTHLRLFSTNRIPLPGFLSVLSHYFSCHRNLFLKAFIFFLALLHFSYIW